MRAKILKYNIFLGHELGMLRLPPKPFKRLF